MKTIRLFICGLVFLAGTIFSGAATAPTAPQGNRYLLVVETAKPMKKALPAVQQCVQSLLTEGMSGQLQRGDTLGIWTYNDELHAGNFPMQVWTGETAAALAKRVGDFLGKQSCAGGARIQAVLQDLFPVIADSDRITVLIFSDGFELIEGTPFDAVINRVFTQHREELRTARVPFVTVLQAVGGKIIHCTVNAASGPINIPALPKPVAVTVAPKPAPPAPAPIIVKTNPPLILDFSKPATNAARLAPDITVAPKELPKIESPPAPTNLLPAAVAVTPEALPPLTNVPPATQKEVPPVIQPVAPAPTPTPTTAPAPGVKPTAEIPPASVVAIRPATPARPAESAPRSVAAATPTTTEPNWGWLVIGLGGLGIVGWLIWRGRAASRTSAITESIERRKR